MAGGTLPTLCQQIRRWNSRQPIYRMVTVVETLRRQDTRSAVDLAALRQCRVVAFVGIGNPQAFVSTLTQLGAEVVALLVFPDHHPYTQEDWRTIMATVNTQQAGCLVTTEKDAVRLVPFWHASVPLYTLRIGVTFAASDPLFSHQLQALMSHADSTNHVLYGLAVSALHGLARLPFGVAYWLGARLGDLLYLVLARRRRITLDNLAIAFGADKTAEERRQIARATFRNLGQHLVDFSHVRRLTLQRFTTMCHVEGLEHVETLLQRGRGLLIISAHFGSWELAPAVALCLNTPLHVIVRPLDSPALQGLAEIYRQCCGYHAIAKRAALAECLKVLRRGEIVAVLMDQSSLRHESIQVEFFGTGAYTSKGPALLALRTGCPVVGGFLMRAGQGHHRLVFSQEIPVRHTGDLQQDIVENTRVFTQ
jgi:KDO2-lipid IV(A) lauroyltransferase